MTGTDLCVNKPHLSRSYLNHLVHPDSEVHTHLLTWYVRENPKTAYSVNQNHHTHLCLHQKAHEQQTKYNKHRSLHLKHMVILRHHYLIIFAVARFKQ
jgi:hypothetical protein